MTDNQSTIYIISDVELGQGDNFDDFKDEEILINFIKRIDQTTGTVQLIFNGDTFDFLKMSYQGNFVHHITSEISLWKINRIFQTYPKIFAALREFLKNPQHSIFFVIGNHDFDLLWPEVQQEIKKELHRAEQINFGHYFQNQDIHVEHGNQVDYFYKIDTDEPFIKHRQRKLLNLPLGSVAVTKYFIELKKEFPIEEKMYPRHRAFESFPEFRKLKQKISLNFLFKGLLFNFIINLFDPISNVPYLNLIKHILAHGLEVTDESKFIKKRFRNLRKLHPNKKAYIMGHVHITQYLLNTSKEYFEIITDTWREEIKILPDNKQVFKPKTYVEIFYQNDQLQKIDLLTFNP